MRWYLIMIPFLSLFTYSTYKWEIYNSKIDEMDLIVLNSLYEATDLNKLRIYDEIPISNLENYLFKNLSLESQVPLNTTLDIYSGDDGKLTLLIKWTSHLKDEDISINKNYILDTSL